MVDVCDRYLAAEASRSSSELKIVGNIFLKHMGELS